MTTPAADCGVTAGCGACPLGRAGVCGDPGTETETVELPRRDDTVFTRSVRESVGDLYDQAGQPRKRTRETDWAALIHEALLAEGIDPFAPDLDPEARPFRCPHRPMPECDSHGCTPVPGAGVWRGWQDAPADDTPDRDPAEPRPAGAGCCGGGCGG